MTTRKFSAISLAYPRYALGLGSLNLSQKDLNLAKWIPRFNNLVHVIEVKKTGSLLISGGDTSADIFDPREFIGSHLIIEKFRLELLLRRDFLSKFINKGTVHLVQDYTKIPNEQSTYKIQTSDNNVVTITMNEFQYRRFGLVAKKVLQPSKATGCKYYQIEIDLKDERLVKSNKFQDRQIQILSRLEALDRVYFRFVPHVDNSQEPNNECLEFFNFVIDEYAKDGFKPVPLTSCYKRNQTIVKRWTNYSQIHPELSLKEVQGSNLMNCNGGILLEIVDWLGYQLLSMDCNKEEIKSTSNYSSVEPLDVSCTELGGLCDFEQIGRNIQKLFKASLSDSVIVLRAMILYHHSSSPLSSSSSSSSSSACDTSCTVFLQDCSPPSDLNLISVIGLNKA